MIIRRIGHAPVATVHYSSSKQLWGSKCQAFKRRARARAIIWVHVFLVASYAKEEVLLNEIELELKAEGIISMYHGQ